MEVCADFQVTFGKYRSARLPAADRTRMRRSGHAQRHDRGSRNLLVREHTIGGNRCTFQIAAQREALVMRLEAQQQ